jgi:stage II sporulation protein D
MIGFFGLGLAFDIQAAIPFSKEPDIRIRMGESQSQGLVRGFDLRAAGQMLADRQSAWSVTCEKKHVILTQSGSPPRKYDGSVVIESPGGFLKWNDVQIRDRLRVVPHAKDSGRCDFINELPLERYLIGLVNTEFNSKWAPQAIQAQVIAARTYALHEMQRTAGKAFDLESTVKDQVYDGSKKEDHLAARAVEQTRGQVLVARTASSELLRSFYHSTCGGLTELPEKVWGRAFPGLKKRVSCSFCQASPKYRWRVELTRAELVKKLGLPGIEPKGVFQLEKGEGGRVRHVKWIPQVGMPRVLSGVEFRSRIGTQTFPSSRFDVSQQGGERFVFEGGGYGHGVGLCQWGAKVMGEKGFSAKVILQHYFPDAEVQSIYP